MPYNFAADMFAQRNFAAYLLQKKSTFIRKTATLRFEPPLGANWGQRTLSVLGLLESP